MAVLGWLPPLVSLSLWSVIFGVLFLLVFAKCSSQNAIRRIKVQIHAALLEAIIFRHDLVLSLKAQARMLKLTGAYMGRTLPPLLVLIPLCLPVLAQLNRLYGLDPLPVKQQTILTVTLTPEFASHEITLRDDPHFLIQGPLRDNDARKAFFRIIPIHEGILTARVLSDGNEIGAIQIHAGAVDAATGIASLISDRWSNTLFYPHDKSISRDATKIQELELSYPSASYQMLYFSFSWIVVFFVVSLVAGLAASKILHIEV